LNTAMALEGNPKFSGRSLSRNSCSLGGPGERHSPCPMDNRCPLLVETPAGNLSRGMRQPNSAGSQRVN